MRSPGSRGAQWKGQAGESYSGVDRVGEDVVLRRLMSWVQLAVGQPCSANKHCNCGERAALLSHVGYRYQSTAQPQISIRASSAIADEAQAHCRLCLHALLNLLYHFQCCVISTINHAALTPRPSILDLSTSILRPTRDRHPGMRHDLQCPLSIISIPSTEHTPRPAYTGVDTRPSLSSILSCCSLPLVSLATSFPLVLPRKSLSIHTHP